MCDIIKVFYIFSGCISGIETQETTLSFEAEYRDGDTEALFQPSWYGYEHWVQVRIRYAPLQEEVVAPL